MKYTNFKKTLILLFLMFLFSSCERSLDYYIVFRNESDKTIIIGNNYSYPTDSTKMISNMLSQPYTKVNPKSSVKLTTGGVKLSSWYQTFYFAQAEGHGVISFYIIEDKVRNDDEKESLIKEYDILARYDVTQIDIEYTSWTLVYPPSTEMQYIHMFPPYEEVCAKVN